MELAPGLVVPNPEQTARRRLRSLPRSSPDGSALPSRKRGDDLPRARALVSAGLARGRRLPSWPGIQVVLRNASGKWVDEPVVHDDNLVASRVPHDLRRLTGRSSRIARGGRTGRPGRPEDAGWWRLLIVTAVLAAAASA